MESFSQVENNKNLSDIEKLLCYFWLLFSSPLDPIGFHNAILDYSITNSINIAKHKQIESSINASLENQTFIEYTEIPQNNIVPFGRKP
jgi:hypothetical protein